MTTPTSLRDWIAEDGITVIGGAWGTGKSTLLDDLTTQWHGPSFYFSYHEVSPRKQSTRFQQAVAICQVTTIEELAKLVETLRGEGPPSNTLVVVDDFNQLSSPDLERINPPTKPWCLILQRLREMRCTIVLTASHRYEMRDRVTLPMFRYADTVLELDEIARHDGGVIVEVIATKDRRRPQGPKGRLWVRPRHQTPVRTT